MHLFQKLVAIAYFTVSIAEASPHIHGLNGKHPLTERQQGEMLIRELRCVACHEDAKLEGSRSSAPDLNTVGQRVQPDFLQKFLANPHKVQPGVKMPDLLAGKSDDERGEISEALTHYLVSLSKSEPSSDKSSSGKLAEGKKLFLEVGCVACHDSGGQDLQHVRSKYQPGALADFLFQPLKVRPSGRMPDFHLSRREARQLSAYLTGSSPKEPKTLSVNKSLVEKGKKHFRELNCAACHTLEGDNVHQLSKPLRQLNASQGCLSENPKNAPKFALSNEQKSAIRKALSSPPSANSTKENIHQTLTAFNCIACHKRDDFGGPQNDKVQHFHSTQEGLGDHGRIPPELTNVGAKLKPIWLHKVMFDGESSRPYMKTRMPNFGEANLSHLPGQFAEMDSIKTVSFAEPGRKEQGSIRSAGHKLVGDKGLNCITCHTFNGKASPSFQGMDLLKTYERLQPSWYYHFMSNPQKHRPGIVMPIYWSAGKGAHKDILDGDADAQIWSIWHYLSYGQGAPTPSGINQVGTNLDVTDQVRTYRGRSGVAGYRGIAVGFPGGMNYAFNAETGALSAIWSGDFVSVGWGGQGAGNFNPRSRPIQLSQDFPILKLKDLKSPWPKRPVMTKENPVNPDPLYPKNLGYQFKGYEFDDQWIPAFQYQAGKVAINDRSVAHKKGESIVLKRTLQFQSPQKETLHFRILTGEIEKVSHNVYVSGKLHVSLGNLLYSTARKLLVRPAPDNPDIQELILDLELTSGTTSMTLEYEILQ